MWSLVPGIFYMNVFKVQHVVARVENFLPFYGMCHCTGDRSPLIPLPADGHLGCLHPSALVHNATISVCTRVYLSICLPFGGGMRGLSITNPAIANIMGMAAWLGTLWTALMYPGVRLQG